MNWIFLVRWFPGDGSVGNHRRREPATEGRRTRRVRIKTHKDPPGKMAGRVKKGEKRGVGGGGGGVIGCTQTTGEGL